MDNEKRSQRDLVRFWARVQKPPDGHDGCWLWTAMKDKDGYGMFVADRKNIKAHRYSMQIHLGYKLKSPTRQLLGNELVLHTCNRPDCVNPDHLFLGSQVDNIRDRDKKARQSRGVHRYNHKITDDDVREMRDLHQTGNWTLKRLGIRYGLDLTTVWAIVHRKGWSHVLQCDKSW